MTADTKLKVLEMKGITKKFGDLSAFFGAKYMDYWVKTVREKAL